MKEKTELKLRYSEIKPNNKIPVIIVAAGNSSRMRGTDKQFLKIGEEAVITKTLKKFDGNPYISKIILVTKEESVLLMQELCNNDKIGKISDIICGGATRHESVLKGIERLSNGEENVLIHDGARPFVSDEIINSVVSGLDTADCALAAVKVNDTVKKTDGEDTVLSTVDRKGLYLAQTPQGVNVKKYLSACNLYPDFDFTDDASVMEKAGYKTVVCKGSPFNIKITSPEDINFAEAINNSLKENDL